MMLTTKKALRVGLLFTTGALFVALMTAAPATAAFSQNQDNGQLNARLNQLETQMQTLSRAVYKGGPMPEIQSTGDMNGNAGAYEDRISQLEQQQRQLTGKVEQLSYDIQQLQERLNRQQSDNYAAPAPAPQPMQAQSRSSYGDSYPYPSSQQSNNNGGFSYSAGPQTADNGNRHLLGNMSSRGGGSGSADSLYEDAFSDISGQKYESASAKFQQFMSQYPTHPLASNAQYWLAETYYVRGDFKQSAKLFAQGYQNYPQGTKAAASLLKLGMSLSRIGKKDDACLSFQQLKKEFPGGQTPEIRAADSEMKQLGCAG